MLNEIRPIGIVRRGVRLDAGLAALMLGGIVRLERLLHRAGLVALPVAGMLGAAAGVVWAWPDVGQAVLAALLGALIGASALCLLFVAAVTTAQLALGGLYRTALVQACSAEGARLIGTDLDLVETERHWSFRETTAVGISRTAGMVVRFGYLTGWHLTLLPLERVSEASLQPAAPGPRWRRGEAAHVTLYWTDAAGEPGATVAWFGRDNAAARRFHAAITEDVPARGAAARAAAAT